MKCLGSVREVSRCDLHLWWTKGRRLHDNTAHCHDHEDRRGPPPCTTRARTKQTTRERPSWYLCRGRRCWAHRRPAATPRSEQAPGTLCWSLSSPLLHLESSGGAHGGVRLSDTLQRFWIHGRGSRTGIRSGSSSLGSLRITANTNCSCRGLRSSFRRGSRPSLLARLPLDFSHGSRHGTCVAIGSGRRHAKTLTEWHTEMRATGWRQDRSSPRTQNATSRHIVSSLDLHFTTDARPDLHCTQACPVWVGARCWRAFVPVWLRASRHVV